MFKILFKIQPTFEESSVYIYREKLMCQDYQTYIFVLISFEFLTQNLFGPVG